MTAAMSRVHQIKKWTILDTDLMLDKGELTTTLKIKRLVVQNNYMKEIEEMYKEAGPNAAMGEVSPRM